MGVCQNGGQGRGKGSDASRRAARFGRVCGTTRKQNDATVSSGGKDRQTRFVPRPGRCHKINQVGESATQPVTRGRGRFTLIPKSVTFNAVQAVSKQRRVSERIV